MIAFLNAASRVRGSISPLTHWRLKLALSLHLNSRKMPLQIVCKMSGKALMIKPPKSSQISSGSYSVFRPPLFLFFLFLNYGPKKLDDISGAAGADVKERKPEEKTRCKQNERMLRRRGAGLFLPSFHSFQGLQSGCSLASLSAV